MKFLATVLLLTLVILLSSCWDVREIDELGLVMLVGIDLTDHPEEKYRVTVEVARPSPAGGSPGATVEGGPFWTASADGTSIFDAIRRIGQFSSRRLMWAHNQVIIVGESMAREDINPIIDFFTRNNELRLRTWIAISEGNAEDYLKIQTGLEDIPAMSITQVFRQSELPALSRKTEVLDVFADFLSEARQPLVARLEIRQRLVSEEGAASESEDGGGEGNGSEETTAEHGEAKQVMLSGAAVFKGSSLVGWLSPEEARGVAWLRGDISNAIIPAAFEGDMEKIISVEIRGANAQIRTDVSGSLPKFTVEITGHGDVVEQLFLSKLPIETFKDKAKEAVEREIKNSVASAIHRVQTEFQSDVLLFGRTLHIQQRNAWKERFSTDWERLFVRVPVEITVDIPIDMTSLYQIPYQLH